ncbi:phosphotransferase enzyme family protein [Flavisolibacter nicotianae]|uniref:phosphotransferase enzyme family protein n=1 Tax=Flavisolibacter nicotianae TaxID=2364882 RepID=UPI000EB094D1|nr:aminoglycoside phosphotransferase family protein [Flavisolibacter nicotianae]
MQTKLIIAAYGLHAANCTAVPFGTGLINRTWKVSCKRSGTDFILQRLNTAVFKDPYAIGRNISDIAGYLDLHSPGYRFIAPLKTIEGDELYRGTGQDEVYRMFPFLADSLSFDVVHNPQQAYEAARQFALFTKLLAGFSARSLRITLPDFHNLSLRFAQFQQALTNGDPARGEKAADLIEFLQQQEAIVATYEAIKGNPEFKIRVTHHDTKISNVLFDSEDKGLCVIDLDTVMPGYFISDVGDMLRTYLSAANEEEWDVEKITVRDEFFEAIVKGYLSELNEELSETEKKHFVYAGKFMIYMQALRFLTDYLNNDVYYGAKYEGHNLIRAQNQAILLERLLEKEEWLNRIVASCQTTVSQ